MEISIRKNTRIAISLLVELMNERYWYWKNGILRTATGGGRKKYLKNTWENYEKQYARSIFVFTTMI